MNTPIRLMPFGFSAFVKGFLVFVLWSIALTRSEAQASPTKIYQDWQTIDHSVEHEDFSWRVVACGQDNYVLFSVFNEEPQDQTINFTATIADPASGNSFEFQYNHLVTGASIVKADCSGAFFPELRVAIPAGYNPSTLTVSFTF